MISEELSNKLIYFGVWNPLWVLFLDGSQTVLINWSSLIMSFINFSWSVRWNIRFENFENSLNFINDVSKIAEDQNHHPDLKFGWGYAKIKIYTHAISGLAESDFILASKIDQI